MKTIPVSRIGYVAFGLVGALVANGCGADSGQASALADGAGASGVGGSASPGSGSVDLSGGDGSGGTGTCSTDADCDDKNPCTIDACDVDHHGEFPTSLCAHTPAPAGTACDDGNSCTVGDACTASGDCAGSPGGNCMPPAVESCPLGCADNQTKAFPPFVGLEPPGLPASCSGGFEMNNPPKGTYTIKATSPNGASARTLDIEIATYLAPDHLRITGSDGSSSEFTLVDTCSMQTATYADPTMGGCTRPPDESIRQYKVSIPAGTKSLSFDVTGACTPTYLRVLGLCDFAVSPFFQGCNFRLLQ